MTQPIIEITNLTKQFDNTIAVDNLNLTINRGEMFSIVGPDGAGKTTTIRMLCGIIKPTSGNIKLLGYDIKTQIDDIKKNIGYLSQKFSLYGDLTIDENIEFFAEIHKVTNYKKRQNELLEFMRLTPFRDRFAERLSGGMKQKLALTCTLIHSPQILFLDEPTTGVDPVSRRDFWKILSQLLKTGITIVMTTPYLDEAERCSKVGLLNQGRLIVSDTPYNIKKLMKYDIIEIVCKEIRKAFAILKKSDYIKEVQLFGDRLNVVVENKDKDFSLIQDLLKNENIGIINWRVIPATLDNVFISLVKEN